MAKFRKKPKVFEAEQWFPGKAIDGVRVEVVGPLSEAHQRFGVALGTERHYVQTAHGQRAYLAPGDWVIPEPDGRGHYPCKPDIFAESNEPAE